jgi:glutathione S-transferase
MKLYFSPLACSLASRIACYEANAEVSFVAVDLKRQRAADGRDYRQINPLGLVPFLELPQGFLSENAAILQFIAAGCPNADLAPGDLVGRARLQQWLSFIGTELHRGIFKPLLEKTTSEEVKRYALGGVETRFGLLERALVGREFLLEAFSVADAYLFAVLNWTAVTPVDLSAYPAVQAYHRRLGERPSVQRAFAEERELYLREVALERPPAALT